MRNSISIKVKDGAIILPKRIQNAWKEAEVLLFPSRTTLIIKRTQKDLSPLSGLASKISSKKMIAKEIAKEIQNYRRNR